MRKKGASIFPTVIRKYRYAWHWRGCCVCVCVCGGQTRSVVSYHTSPRDAVSVASAFDGHAVATYYFLICGPQTTFWQRHASYQKLRGKIKKIAPNNCTKNYATLRGVCVCVCVCPANKRVKTMSGRKTFRANSEPNIRPIKMLPTAHNLIESTWRARTRHKASAGCARISVCECVGSPRAVHALSLWRWWRRRRRCCRRNGNPGGVHDYGTSRVPDSVPVAGMIMISV